MNPGRQSEREPHPDDRVPDQDESKDTDQVTKRTEAPQTNPRNPGIDSDAPGNVAGETNSDSAPAPNEPA